MIRVKNDPFEIDVTYDWEESDLLIAKTLGHETEQHLLELARKTRTDLMELQLVGTPVELDEARMRQAYMRGQYDLLLLLVAQSKEAKVQAHLI